MRLSKTKGIEYIFFILSVINIFLQLKYSIAYVTYVIYAFIFAGVCTKVIDNERFLLYALFIPNKYLQILTIPIYLFLKGKLFRTRLPKKITLFIGFIFFAGVINCCIYKGLFLATLFQVGLYYCILVLAQQFNDDYSCEKIYIDFFDYVFVLQVFCAILELLMARGSGDNIRGTFESAHYFGVFLLAYLYMLYKVDNRKQKKFDKLIRYALAIVIFILADAKHVFAVVLLSFILVKILSQLHIKRQIMFVGAALLIGSGLFITIAQSSIDHSLIKGQSASTYLYNDKYNKKYAYMVNTLEEMKSINGLIGFGVGQYGSQISITMSKGIIYEWNDGLSAYKYAIAPYKRAIRGLMTEWYTNTGIGMSSMVLGYPLVSFVGMVAELGILGFLLFCEILDELYEKKNKLFIISFIFLTIFDTYLEIACVFVLILFITNIYQKKGKIVIA